MSSHVCQGCWLARVYILASLTLWHTHSGSWSGNARNVERTEHVRGAAGCYSRMTYEKAKGIHSGIRGNIIPILEEQTCVVYSLKITVSRISSKMRGRRNRIQCERPWTWHTRISKLQVCSHFRTLCRKECGQNVKAIVWYMILYTFAIILSEPSAGSAASGALTPAVVGYV